jgi:hypothetical protein
MTQHHVIGLVIVSFFVVGCSSPPPRVVAEPVVSNAGAAAIEAHDADKDGLLSEQELLKAPGLKAGFKMADANLDGKLSAAEIDARVAAWTKSKAGRMTVACNIFQHGMPLADAEVRFVPESFLGSALPTATGKTSGQGMAMPTAPKADAQGVPPGYYRVEIYSANNDIPAAYNTATTLGVEVALDSEAVRQPLRFEIP